MRKGMPRDDKNSDQRGERTQQSSQSKGAPVSPISVALRYPQKRPF